MWQFADHGFDHIVLDKFGVKLGAAIGTQGRRLDINHLVLVLIDVRASLDHWLMRFRLHGLNEVITF